MPSTSAGEPLVLTKHTDSESKLTSGSFSGVSVLTHRSSLHSLYELVKHEENGLIFRDSQELAEQLRVRTRHTDVLELGFPSDRSTVAQKAQ